VAPNSTFKFSSRASSSGIAYTVGDSFKHHVVHLSLSKVIFPWPQSIRGLCCFNHGIRRMTSWLLKFRYISYVYFITLPCILLLSLCFGSTCTPLTLLQLRYILWCFIDCFRIIFGDLTCAFLSGVKDFMHLLCTIIGHDISNIHITPS